ncbi:MAG: hypothetical protein K1X75_05705 [Leptospirales bacterium]|nr:hypothetical protein [Leptospirales bacterium]
MNAVHLHLILNHLPIVAILLATVLLLASLLVRTRGFLQAALAVLVFAGVSGAPAYFSGEEAEESAEHSESAPQQSEPDNEVWLEAHEQAAKFGLGASIVCGLAGVGLLFWLARRPDAGLGAARGAALALALFSSVILARVGQTGGRIAHPETRPLEGAAAGAEFPAPGGKENEEEDEGAEQGEH